MVPFSSSPVGSFFRVLMFVFQFPDEERPCGYSYTYSRGSFCKPLSSVSGGQFLKCSPSTYLRSNKNEAHISNKTVSRSLRNHSLNTLRGCKGAFCNPQESQNVILVTLRLLILFPSLDEFIVSLKITPLVLTFERLVRTL